MITAPGAPIMGQRRIRLLIGAKATMVAARMIRASHCKECCGDAGRIARKDRSHTLTCRKLVGLMPPFTDLMKAPTSGARMTKIQGLMRQLITRSKVAAGDYCTLVCGKVGRVKRVDREHLAQCRKMRVKLANLDRSFRGI